jgi:aryl-alcohol dehydrogenase-like predicted oxidoreductase
MDKKTPIEKTMQALVELKNEGKIKHIGLSECTADTIRRAHKVHPVTAVQMEYSVFCLAIEEEGIDILRTCRELGIAVVAYSPLGNGLLTGTLRKKDDWTQPGDLRGALPWLRDDVFDHNLGVVDQISDLAKSKGISAAQLALAWVLKQGDDVFAIPGTKSVKRLEDNLAAMDVTLTDEEEKEVRKLSSEIKGGRVQDLTGFSFGWTPPLEDA